MLTAIIVLAILLLAVVLVLKFYPALGGVLTKEQQAAFSHLPHYQDGKFKNLSTTVMDNNAGGLLSMLRDYMRTNPNRRPQAKLPLQQLQFGGDDKGEQAQVTWFGHSAMLLELDGKHILLDPMFGQAPSPFPFSETSVIAANCRLKLPSCRKLTLLFYPMIIMTIWTMIPFSSLKTKFAASSFRSV